MTRVNWQRLAFELSGHGRRGTRLAPAVFFWDRERPDCWLFGSWFSSRRFPEWAISRLEQFVEVVPLPEPDHAVAEQLFVVSQVDVEAVVRILDRIIRGSTEGWRFYQWREPVTAILEKAMQTAGEARDRAVDIINYLGRRGYTELGVLLDAAP